MKTLKVTHEGKQYFIDVEQERPLETLLRKYCNKVDEIFEKCVDDLEELKKEYGLLCNMYFRIPGINDSRQRYPCNYEASAMAQRQAMGLRSDDRQFLLNNGQWRD